jgi:hypothetical protein
MATSVSSVISHFPDAENGFTTTTAGSVGSGATTVTLNSVGGYTNGQPVVLVIDPTDAAKKQTFTGIVDTGGVQITDVVWTAGTNQTHALGATVVDYATATHIAMISKGIQVNHYQTGYHKTLSDTNGNEWIKQTATGSAVNEVTIANAATGNGPTISATGDNTNIDLNLSAKGTGMIKPKSFMDGWVYNTLPAVSSVTNNGNRSADVVFASTVASLLTPGMRVRGSRTVAAPTQCTDLESGSSQYFNDTSLTGMTFTDDFTAMGWVKLESYTGAVQTIISRYNGTSGWALQIGSAGQVEIIGRNAAAGNYKLGQSYQSVPLNKWVHVAANLDMSASTALIYIDGVLVPSANSTTGTNPTALIQAGNLEIGAQNSGTLLFDGKLAQVAVFSAVISASTIRSYMNQGLSGSETNLVSAYSFNNSIIDLNANANNLTAQGSAVATNADSPFSLDANGVPGGTYEWGIVTKVSTTTATVQFPEGSCFPTSGGVSAVELSAWKAPFGMPVQRGKWRLQTCFRTSTATTSNATYGAFNSAGFALNVPIGEWDIGWEAGYVYNAVNTTVTFNISSTALTGMTLAAGNNASPYARAIQSAAAAFSTASFYISKPQSLSAAATYVMYTLGATTSAAIEGGQGDAEIFAECAYL